VRLIWFFAGASGIGSNGAAFEKCAVYLPVKYNMAFDIRSGHPRNEKSRFLC
jgi:hypothetical protein